MKIAALISGGVDSSVALALLKKAGHDVTAFYLKIWLEDELSHLGDCPWEQDLVYARSVCDQLGVPLRVLSLQQAYHDKVVAETIAEVKAGRTPNPDVWCNERVKFGAFYDMIGDEFEKVATGHYAQVRDVNGTYQLHRAPDPIKDQTYFLCNLSQVQLSRAMFPIGHLQKSQVRELAEEFDLPTKARKDSQGICFLGKIKFHDFVAAHLGTQEGEMREYESGTLLGTHEGNWFYTIGQRHGIKRGDGPWYVAKKDPEQNIVYISRNYEAIDGPRKAFDVQGFSSHKRELLVKVRHKSVPAPCTVEGSRVTLATKDQGIAPGQHAVFYDGDVCVGSGVIS